MEVRANLLNRLHFVVLFDYYYSVTKHYFYINSFTIVMHYMYYVLLDMRTYYHYDFATIIYVMPLSEINECYRHSSAYLLLKHYRFLRGRLNFVKLNMS